MLQFYTATQLKSNVSKGDQRSVISLFFLLSFCLVFLGKLSAQTYVNGNLSTGALNSSLTAAPSGYTWSEIQSGNNTWGSTSTVGSFALADDFTVTCGPWPVSKFTVYGYVSGYSGSTSPFNDIKLAIYNADPSVGAPVPIYGDLTTNRFSSSSSAFMYRILNGVNDLTRQIWKIEVNIPAGALNLNNGTYWLVYSLGNNQALASNSPHSTVIGTLTQAGNNAKQKNIVTNTWAAVTDNGGAQDLAFTIDYNTPVCVGTPAPGNTLSTATGAICSSVPFVLSTSNSSCGSGIGFQWQYSINGGTSWVDISGANQSTLSSTYSSIGIPASQVNVQFRLKVTCASSGGIGFSTAANMTQSPLTDCYCIPGTTNCAALDDIINVTFGGMNNTTSECINNGYSDFTSSVAPGNVLSGVGNPISVKVNNGGFESAGVWIDYNQNGVFEASEFTLLGSGNSTAAAGGIVFNAIINIPSAAISGSTRMRVRSRFGGVITATETCNSYTYGQTEDYRITITPATACAGTPATPTISSTAASVCPGVNFTLSVTNASSFTSFSGLTTQWEQSTDGGVTWTPITGATFFSYTTSQLSATRYRFKVTCGTSAVTSTSAALTINMSPANACYCIPTSNGADNDIALNVNFGGINNNSGNALNGNGYSDYTGTVWPAPLNTNYGIAYRNFANPISVTVRNFWTENVAVWIDYNQNGTFDTDEYTFIGSHGGTFAAGETVLSNTVTIPNTSLLGITRMRVRVVFSTTPGPGNACTPYSFGEAEDYLIDIRDLVTCSGTPALGTMLASTPSACASEPFTVTISNATTLAGTQGLTFQWQSSPNGTTGWTDITGATGLTLSTSLTANTYYRILVTCASTTATSASILVTLTPATSCYCVSQASLSNSSDISNVTISTLNNTSDCNSVGTGAGSIANQYSNYTSGAGAPAVPIVYSGTTNAFSVSLASCVGNASSGVAIWIDLNKNGLFEDATEKMYVSAASSGTYPRTESGFITIPAVDVFGDSIRGVTRMRVVNTATTTPSSISACGVYNYGETEDYNVNIQYAPVCNNTFTPNISTSANPVCPGASFTLSITNAAGISGLTYQWQTATSASGPWTNISGATNSTYTTSTNTGACYRVQAYCGPSVTTSNSAAICITLNTNPSACFCTPTTTAGATDAITNVTFGGINNNSGYTATGYTNYTSTIAPGIGTKGSLNPISVSIASGSSANQSVAVWIDYNQNGVFETNEYTSLGTYFNGGLATGSINIPITALNGLTRMRVRSRRTTGLPNGILGSGDACTTYGNGETEDYLVNLLSCTPVTVEAQPGNATVSCGNNAVFNVAASTAFGTISYQWLVKTTPTGSWTPVVNGAQYSGATSASLTVTAPPLTFNGYAYAVAMNASCIIPDTSNSAFLAVNPSGANDVTTEPVNVTLSCGNNASFSFVATLSGGTGSYQWQVRPNASSAWSNVVNNTTFGGATTTTLTLTNVTNALSGYQFRAYVTTPCGSADTTLAATLTVNPVSLNLSIVSNAPANTICNGSSVTFTATPSYSGSLTVGYRWYIDNAATANAASSGTTINVASTSMLAVGMGVSVASGVGLFAANTTVASIINATSFTVSAAPTTPLQAGAVITANPVTPATTYTTSTLTNGAQIRCRALVSDASNCTVPNPAFSNTITMTVTPNATTTVDLTTTSTTVCANTNVVFTATPTNGGATPTYQFYVGGTLVQSGTANTYSTSTLTNGQQVVVRMTSVATNCPAPNPASDTLTMTVNPSFPVSVTLSANPGGSGPVIASCVGQSVTFTAAGVNPGTSPVYVFKKNGSVVQTGATNTYTTAALANGDVITCELTSSITSCAPGNPATSNSLTINISTQTASVSLTTNPVNVCAGSTVTYTASATNGGSTPSFQFYVNGNAVASSGNTYTYVPSSGDSISVEMSSSFACAIPNPATTYIIQSLVDRPTASITLSTATCITTAATLDAGAAAGSGTISGYQWQSGPSITGPWTNIATSSTGATYFAGTTGFYTVVVTNSLGCTFTAPGYSLTLPLASTPMSGTYTIGAVTATANAASSGVTINVASTANLSVGALVTVMSGTGAFAANTVITSIVNATSFTVNNTPSTAIQSGAVIAGATCTNYISFKTAFADLNTRTINGNCTFNVSAGYVENLTARIDLGSTALNATMGGRTITFQKSGIGANPVINAYTGTGLSNTTPDGMVALLGIDNVTIDGINLNDGNTASTTTMMEYGYGLFRLSTTAVSVDGPQNNTIKNCKISLNRNNNNAAGAIMPPGSAGIVSANSLAGSANTALTAGGAAGAASNNKFYNDSIVNCNYGIALTGIGAAAPYTDGDAGNDIGGATAATGNWIINFGGATGATIQAAGVWANNQWGLNISNNIINNGSATPHAAALRGIHTPAGTAANITINGNTISLYCNGTTAAVYGIDNAIGNTGSGNAININNNSITGSYTTATTGAWYGINNTAAATTLNFNGNSFNNTTYTASGAGNWNAIFNGAACLNLNINNSSIQGNTITSAGTSGASNTFINSAALQSTASAPFATANINGNNIVNNVRNLTAAVATGANNISLTSSVGGTVSISNNTISNNIANINGAMAAALTYVMINRGQDSVSNITNNNLSNNGINVNNAGATGAHGIIGINTASNVNTENITGNTIRRFFVSTTNSTASAARMVIYGISSTGAVSKGTKNISNNQIDSFYTASGYTALIYGVRSALGQTVNIEKNKITCFWPGQSATLTGLIAGISIPANGNSIIAGVNTKTNIINNMISLVDSLPSGIAGVGVNTINSADGIRGIELLSTIANSTLNLYNNTIRLGGTGVTNFGSSGIYHTASATQGTATLHLRNNIIANNCVAVGTGLTVALRRSAANLISDSTASNNNIFYAGTAASGRLFYDPTNTAISTLAQLQTLLGPSRETASKNFMPLFVSPTDLHIQACDASSAQVAGQGSAAVTPAVSTDIDNESRANPPAIGADEFTSTSFAGSVSGATAVCSGTNSGTLTLISYTGTITGWESSIDGGTTWTAIANTNATYTFSNLTQNTLFRALVAGSCGVGSSPSLSALVTVNALPTISLTNGGAAAATANVCVGNSLQLFGTASPAFANPWVSGTTAAATISTTGLLVGVASGSSTITYTNTNGCISTLTLTVSAGPTISGPSSVCIGGTITLTGTGTPNTVTPWTSSLPANATINNAGLVTGVAAGTTNIVFTNNAGCQSPAYTVTVNPRPVISGVTTLCLGASATLTGTPTAAAVNPWVSANTGIVSVNSSGFITGVSVNSTTVTYTNSNGCTSAPYTITVNTSPVVSLSGSPVTTAAVCSGSTITLTGNGTAATPTAWTSSNTAIASVNATTGVVTGVAAGTCNITYTNSSGCSKTVILTVRALPTIYDLMGGGSYCIDNPAGVEITLGGSDPGVNYQLQLAAPLTNLGSPEPGSGSEISYGQSTYAAGNYQVLATNTTTGCQVLMVNPDDGSNFVNVGINPLPVISLTNGGAAASTASVCAGGTLQLYGTATAAINVDPWTTSDFNFATVSSTGLVTGVAAGSATITYVNTNGCSKTININITTPSVAGTATGSAGVCPGTNSTVLSLTGYSGTIQWQSSPDNVTFTNIIGATSPTYTATNLSATTYYHAVVTNGGCAAEISNSVNVSINPAPNVYNVTGSTAICAGGNAVPIGLSGSQVGVTYNVFAGATLVGTANGTGAAITLGNAAPSATTIYTVVAVNNITTCSSNMNGNATITINNRPTVTISPAGPVNICEPNTQQLSAVSNIGSVTYQWYLNDVAIPGATAINYTAGSAGVGSGVYSVIATTTGTSCISLRSPGTILTVNPKPLNVAVSPATTDVCPSLPTVLTVTSDPVEVSAIALLEDFNGAASAWTASNGPTSPAISNWTTVTTPYSFSSNQASTTFNQFTTQNGGKFGMAFADATGGSNITVTSLVSPTFSLSNYVNATLTFEHALHSSTFTDNFVQIDISTDGGTTWNLLRDYWGQNAGSITDNAQTTVNESINLSTYIGPSVKLRFRYESDWGYYWIVDNIKISGTKENPTAYTWSPATSLSATTGSTVTATPTASITYTATASAAGCTNSAQASINITPNPAITTQPSFTGPVCEGNGVITLDVVATGAQNYTWRKGGVPVANGAVISGQGSATLTLTNPTSADAGTYDVVVDGFCTSVTTTSNPVTVTIVSAGSWLGVNNDWEDAANWCGGIPTSSSNVTIPVSANYPIINTTTPVCGNLTIATGANVTVNGKLKIAGNITPNGAIIARSGTIEMNGSSAQTIPANTFQNNLLGNLVINNSSVTLGGNLNLLVKLSFLGSNRTFATAGFLTLKSSDTLTASVGDITLNNTVSGNQITGNVTVERFIKSRRAWRLLSMPTQHNFQTIKQAWQEGATLFSQNPNSGFGIQITSNRPSWIADGFDTFSVAGPSIKFYNPTNGQWDGLTSTNISFATGRAYMTFIRGDRSVFQLNQSPTSATLREKGSLVTGPITIPSLGTASNQFVGVGNPYASAIDFTKLSRVNLFNQFYLWDPLLGSFGGYQTCLVDAGGNISYTPGGGSYGTGPFYIQSGQGFLVRTQGGIGSLTFNENSKVDGSLSVARNASTAGTLSTRLYQLQNGTPVLYDGVLSRFGSDYSNGTDNDDAEKMGNFNENLGIIANNKVLAIESRSNLTANDTIFYKLGQVRATSYRFEWVADQVTDNGLQAFLEDLFTGSLTPINLNGNTSYDFTVSNAAGSYASNRFRIVFRPLAPVPVSFTDIRADKEGRNARITWKVENETGIDHYKVEESADGRIFNSLTTVTASGSNQYSAVDQSTFTGNNFYRVLAIENSGVRKYSQVVKVNFEAAPYVHLFPNPVKQDRKVNVQLQDVKAGKYAVRLVNVVGQVLESQTIMHNGTNRTYELSLDLLKAHGNYQLELIGEDNAKTVLKFMF